MEFDVFHCTTCALTFDAVAERRKSARHGDRRRRRELRVIPASLTKRLRQLKLLHIRRCRGRYRFWKRISELIIKIYPQNYRKIKMYATERCDGCCALFSGATTVEMKVMRVVMARERERAREREPDDGVRRASGVSGLPTW